MLRSGVSFPGVMKRLGHNSSDMTMKYLDIAWPDLQREFHSARLHPLDLVPQPKVVTGSVRFGLHGVIDSVLGTQHVLEMFRRTLPDNAVHAVLSVAFPIDSPKCLANSEESTQIGRDWPVKRTIQNQVGN